MDFYYNCKYKYFVRLRNLNRGLISDGKHEQPDWGWSVNNLKKKKKKEKQQTSNKTPDQYFNKVEKVRIFFY